MGGAGLLILAVVTIVMSDSTWAKVLSFLWLLLGLVVIIHEYITEGFDAYYTILIFMLILVGIIAKSIQDTVDPKPRDKDNS